MIFNAIIPTNYYIPIFYNSVLLLVFITYFKLISKEVDFKKNSKEYASIMLLALVTLYIGLRPLNVIFGDMGAYNSKFIFYQEGMPINFELKDYLWDVFMKFCSGFMTVTTFFLLCAFIYIYPLYTACKKWFGANKYIPFLMLIASFSFWSYGTNGIRNGIATSLFIYAITRDNLFVKYGFFFIAFSIHGSLMIPILAYILTMFFKNPKHYLLGWLVAIPLSIGLGGFWEGFFMSLGFGGDRMGYLTDDRFVDQFSSLGFRWDFVVYSAAAVFTGYYFIVKKKFKDKVYHQIFNIYVTANAFWILVIRASFSNRFAYLSWFLMAIVIFYPFLKEKLVVNQSKKLAFIVVLYFGFTYYMTL